MKKVAILLLAPVLLMVVFTLYPTGSTRSEVMEGYQSTTTFVRSSSSYLLYMSQFRAAVEVNNTKKFAENIGTKIARFAAALCEKLGNGGNVSYSDAGGRKVGQFRYSTSTTAGYSSRDALYQNVQEMLRDPSKTCYISCCGFATFCWDIFLTGHSPYGTGCTTTVANNFQDMIEGDGTAQYVIDNAEPGDLLFYTKTGGTVPPVAEHQNYKHVEIYIGQYSGVDAYGKKYMIDYACAGSNQDRLNRDACIKPLAATVGNSHPYVYMVSLAKWISSGHAPVDNADRVETVENMIG